MTTSRIDFKSIVRFDRNSIDEDLNFNLPSRIKPPPADKRCECCGSHIRRFELFSKSIFEYLHPKPFEETLILKLRRLGPYDKEAQDAVVDAEKHLTDAGCEGNDPLQLMIKKYGSEKGIKLYCSYQAYNQIAYSWECIDCVNLNYEEHHDKLKKRFEKESDNK